MVWYFQASPHDVHDWDAVETPVLLDGTIDGQPRKLVAQASRNGYFFVLDRATGKRILGTPLHRDAELGERVRRQGPADRRSQEVSHHRRRAGFAGVERRHQLAGAEFQPADRAVLRGHQPLLQHVLPDRHRRPSRRLGRPGQRRRQRRQRAAGHRLPHGQGGLAARLAKRQRSGEPICPRPATCCSPATDRTSSPSTQPTEKSSGTRV